MNSRERVVAAMRRRQPDRVPFDFALGLSDQIREEFRRRTGADDPDAYFGTDTRGVWHEGTRNPIDHRGYFPELPEGAWIDEWGIGHQPTVSGEAGHAHLEGFLYPMQRLATVAQMRDYPLPDVEAQYRYESLPARVRAHHDQGLAVFAGLHCTVFEIAWYMRSMEQLFADFVDRPEMAEVLLDRITEKRIVQARLYAQTGVDILQLGDDVASQRGMMMSVPMWRSWLKPRLARVIREAKDARPELLIFYHTDGDARAIIPDLIEIGVDILNPVQPECMDPALLKVRYGDRISFWGTIGTQSTMPFGTPDDVRNEIRTRIATVGRGGGLLLAPTHMVEPDVPWDNLIAFVEAAREYGAGR